MEDGDYADGQGGSSFDVVLLTKGWLSGGLAEGLNKTVAVGHRDRQPRMPGSGRYDLRDPFLEEYADASARCGAKGDPRVDRRPPDSDCGPPSVRAGLVCGFDVGNLGLHSEPAIGGDQLAILGYCHSILVRARPQGSPDQGESAVEVIRKESIRHERNLMSDGMKVDGRRRAVRRGT